MFTTQYSNYGEPYQKVLPQSATTYNGLTDIMSGDNMENRIKMFERTAKKNKSTAYGDATKGIWENSVLSDLYFSAANVQIIQNAIRAGVYKASDDKFIIAKPNIDNLHVIMRSTYLSFVKNLPDNITQQISDLNAVVIAYCVKELYSASQSYLYYAKDQSSMPVPIDHMQQVDKNRKELEFKRWFN